MLLNISAPTVESPLTVVLICSQGTVLLKNAAELKEFSKGEEDLLEQQLVAIKEAGVSVIVAGTVVREYRALIDC
jgi:T-complex protein 1 subunit theta